MQLLDTSIASRREKLLEATNTLLETLDLEDRKFHDWDELVVSASSMGVALYERLFQSQIDGINRRPQDAQDYVDNADRLAGALQQTTILADNEDSVLMQSAMFTGEKVCAGDESSLEVMVRLLQRIYDALYGGSKSPRDESHPSLAHKADSSVESARLRSSGSAYRLKRRMQSSSKSKRDEESTFLRQRKSSGRREPLHTSDSPVSSDRGKREEEADPALENRNETQAKTEGMYFGDVSSVSLVGGSDHFMEEEGDFARHFSHFRSDTSSHNTSKPSHKDIVSNAASEKQVREVHSSVEEEGGKVATKQLDRVRKTSSPGPRRANTRADKELLRYKIALRDHLQELRQKEVSKRREMQRSYRVGTHNAAIEKIRSKRLEQDLRLRRVAVGLEAKEQEERHLQQVMAQALQLEKEKLREERHATSSILKRIQKDHTRREEAVEHFYSTQIQMVQEQTQKEQEERQVIEKAHRSASNQMLRELRRDQQQQLDALLTDQEHLSRIRRERRSTRVGKMLEKEEAAMKQMPSPEQNFDAFYHAAMKARARKEHTSSPDDVYRGRRKRHAAAA